MIAAQLSFAGAGGLVFLATKRSEALLIYATRRQLGLELPPHGAMNYSSSVLESPKTWVTVFKAGIVAQVHALNYRMPRLVKSPYLIAGLVISAAAAGYFAVTRNAKPRAASPCPAPARQPS